MYKRNSIRIQNIGKAREVKRIVQSMLHHADELAKPMADSSVAVLAVTVSWELPTNLWDKWPHVGAVVEGQKFVFFCFVIIFMGIYYFYGRTCRFILNGGIFL